MIIENVARVAYSPAEAAAALGVSVVTIGKMIKNGIVPAAIVGGRRFIKRSDLEALVSQAAPRGATTDRASRCIEGKRRKREAAAA